MSLSTAAEEPTAQEIHIPADIEWQMLDKSKFFLLGSLIFWCFSHFIPWGRVENPAASCSIPCSLRIRGLYRGFGTSLTGTIPARALYMTALEVTKSNVGKAATRLGFPEPTLAAVANAVAGLSAAMAAQVVWTPVDSAFSALPCKYINGVDAFRKILNTDGVRGFGISILTCAPSNVVWWASYSLAQRLVWGGIGCFLCKREEESLENGVITVSNVTTSVTKNGLRPDAKTVMVVQGLSAAMAGGFSALITMPLDTNKTRLQVLDDNENGRKGPSLGQTVRNLVRDGGWMACYRGLGPRWASMSISAITMITTYEFLKRLSAKNQQELTL
ncbi:UNVERIFIED_CONTAM: hypothetical protein Sindi_2037700 [Sesamum indicum]